MASVTEDSRQSRGQVRLRSPHLPETVAKRLYSRNKQLRDLERWRKAQRKERERQHLRLLKEEVFAASEEDEEFQSSEGK